MPLAGIWHGCDLRRLAFSYAESSREDTFSILHLVKESVLFAYPRTAIKCKNYAPSGMDVLSPDVDRCLVFTIYTNGEPDLELLLCGRTGQIPPAWR